MEWCREVKIAFLIISVISCQINVRVKYLGGFRIDLEVNKLQVSSDLLEYSLGYSFSDISRISKPLNKTNSKVPAWLFGLLPNVALTLNDLQIVLTPTIAVDVKKLTVCVNVKAKEFHCDIELSELNVGVKFGPETKTLLALRSLKSAISADEEAKNVDVDLDAITVDVNLKRYRAVESVLSVVLSHTRPSVAVLRRQGEENLARLYAKLDAINSGSDASSASGEQLQIPSTVGGNGSTSVNLKINSVNVVLHHVECSPFRAAVPQKTALSLCGISVKHSNQQKTDQKTSETSILVQELKHAIMNYSAPFEDSLIRCGPAVGEGAAEISSPWIRLSVHSSRTGTSAAEARETHSSMSGGVMSTRLSLHSEALSLVLAVSSSLGLLLRSSSSAAAAVKRLSDAATSAAAPPASTAPKAVWDSVDVIVGSLDLSVVEGHGADQAAVSVQVESLALSGSNADGSPLNVYLPELVVVVSGARCVTVSDVRVMTFTAVSTEGSSSISAPDELNDTANSVAYAGWVSEQQRVFLQDRASTTMISVQSVAVQANQSVLAVVGAVAGRLAGSSDSYKVLPNFFPNRYGLVARKRWVYAATQIDIGRLDVTLSYQDQDSGASHSYSLLSGMGLNVEMKAAGPYYSSTEVFMFNAGPAPEENFALTVSKTVCSGGAEVESNLILKLISDQINQPTDRSSNRILLFSGKSVPLSYHWTSEGVGVAQNASYSSTTLPTVTLFADTIHLKHLLWLLRDYNAASGRVTRQVKNTLGLHNALGGVNWTELNSLSEWTNTHLQVSPVPDRISSTTIARMKLNFNHLLQPVFTLATAETKISSMGFGRSLSQLAVCFNSLQLFEFTSKAAVHTCLIGDMESRGDLIQSGDDAEDGAIGGGLSLEEDEDEGASKAEPVKLVPNRVEMHFTGLHNECGLLEFHAEYLRVLYLQRPTLTLVCYIRDELIADIYKFLTPPVDPETASVVIPAPALRRGMFRLGVLIHKTEIHLPANSCSTDSLSILVNHAHIFKTSEAITRQDANYTKGPYVEKNVWLSQLRNSNRVIDRFFPSSWAAVVNAASDVLPCDWTLVSHISSDLIPPPEVTECGAGGVLILDIALYETTICSWCNNNAVCEGITLTCTYSMQSAFMLTGALYEEELAKIGYEQMHSIRNTMHVHVWATSIDWVLAQGQYFGIVNLIQQNFSELQEVVIDQYILPTPKTVPLEAERCYGQYALNSALPIISTIPIHIASGKILATDNTEKYYDLYNTPLIDSSRVTSMDRLNSAHYSLSAFPDTIPRHSFHFAYRNKLFNRGVIGNAKAHSGFSPLILHDFPAPSYQELELCAVAGAGIISINFVKLEIDFYRLHYGGGNGIEVAADVFVIVGINNKRKGHNNHLDETMDNPDEASSTESEEYNRVAVEDIILAPKNFSLFNRDKFSRERYAKSARHSATMEGGHHATVTSPQIRYSQQGTGNLRRCVVTIDETVAVANLPKIIDLVAYFMKPINVISARNLSLIDRLDKSGNAPYDWKAALDVEVHLTNTVMAMMNSSDAREESSTLCVHLNMHYTHAWRGFLICGPGKIAYTIAADILSIYIAPMHEIYSSSIQSLVDPTSASFSMDLSILPQAKYLHQYLAQLTPWMSFKKWVYKANTADHPSGTRLLSVRVYPTVTVDERNRDESVDDLARLEGTEDTSPRVSEKKTSPSTGQEEEKVEVESVDSEDKEDEEEEEETVKREERPLVMPILRFRLSLKDVNFIFVAIQQLRASLQNMPVKTGDPYTRMLAMTSDIDHLPQLTYYLVWITQTEAWKPDNKELLMDVCDFEFILRNNTYNLNLVKLALSEIMMIYNRSPLRLHMATGLSASVWVFNDAIEDWEPLIEPINMRAIGATDASKKSHSFSVNRASRIKLEVVTEPLEINASQSMLVNLIRKLALADVITTSSIHLPPYKVVNALGVNVKFTIGMGGGIITNNEIPTGGFLPVEVNQLTEALNNYKSRKQYNSSVGRKQSSQDSTGTKEYLMGISFANFKDYYKSNTPVPIDKEGVYPFEMLILPPENNSVPPTPIETVLTAGGATERRRVVSIFGNNNYNTSVANSSTAATPSSGVTGLQPPELVTSPSDSSVVESGSVSASTTTTTTAAAAAAVVVPTDNVSPVSALNNVKYIQETPLAILDMRIKEDGIRELLLRSILSVKNNTNRVFHLSIRLYGSQAEFSLGPGKEWNVPVRFANPKASLYFRLDDRTEWIEGLSSFQSLILSGYWGSPTRLKADMCGCPAEGLPSTINEANENKWLLLIKPEARDHRTAQSQGSTRSFVPVRYPSKEVHKGKLNATASAVAAQTAATENFVETIDGMLYMEDIYNTGGTLKSRGAQPLCIQFTAPLQLCNLVSQPMLYRLADASGLITSEGVLLPGEIIDVHSLFRMFTSKIFISVRMLNYCWSKWTVLFGRSNPYSTSEKAVDITLQSMDFQHQNKELSLPSLDVSMLMKQHLVRFVCPVVISNRTGLQLDFCESSATDSYIPQSSRSAIEAYMPLAPPTKAQKNADKRKQNKRGSYTNSNGMINSAMRDSDDESSSSGDSAGEEGVEGVGGYYDNRPHAMSDGDSDDNEDSDAEEGVTSSNVEVSRTDRGDVAEVASSSLTQHRKKSVDKSVTSQQLQQPTRTVSVGAGKLINLIIHLPHDHLRKVDLIASSEWTLSDVFAHIKNRISTSADYQQECNYVFFPWENGKNGPSKVDNTLIIDSDNLDASVKTAEESSSSLVSGSETRQRLGSQAPPVESEKRGGVLSGRFRRQLSTQSTTSTVSSVSQSSGAAGGGSSDAAEIPVPMSFDMLAECSLNPLPMDTRLDSLKQFRIRLCHESEFNIYRQIRAIKTESFGKEGIFSTMFGRVKYTHLTQFMKFEGDLPFRPHRMLGFNPTLSIRVPFETDWSDAIDLYNADFETSEMAIAVGNGSNTKLQSKQLCHSYYEFGAHVERGKGFLQNITTVTVVPKHIIVSKLPFPIEIRQINVQDNYNPLCLLPGTVQSYHFPTNSKAKLLQIRRQLGTSLSELDNPELWFGEIDICNLGIMFAKLREPMCIIKIQTESVGASLVATLTQQSTKWPPYRIDNMTTVDIRFKQSLAVPESSLPPKSKLRNSNRMNSSGSLSSSHPSSGSLSMSNNLEASQALYTINEEAESSKAPSVASGGGVVGGGGSNSSAGTASVSAVIDFDYVGANSSGSFAWDLPISGQKVLKLEFAQGNNWVSKEVSLDDDSKLETIQIKTNLPALGNPLAEGYLLVQNPDDESWTREYCILRPNALYVYEDETRSNLTHLINISNYQNVIDAEGTETRKMRLAYVTRYVDSVKWDLLNSIQSSMGFIGNALTAITNSSAAASAGGVTKANLQDAVDSNKTRIMLLKLAEFLGMLAHVSRESLHKKDSDDEDEENDIDNREDGNEGASSRKKDVQDSGKSESSTKGFEAPKISELELDVGSLSERTVSSLMEGSGPVFLDEVPVEEKNAVANKEESTVGVGAVAADGETAATVGEGGVPAEGNRSRLNSLRNSLISLDGEGPTLKDLLMQNISVEQLLEEISNSPVRVTDIITALLATEEVDSLDRASEVCNWLLVNGFLVPGGARRAIDRNMTDDEFDTHIASSRHNTTVMEDVSEDDWEPDETEQAGRETMAVAASVRETIFGLGGGGGAGAAAKDAAAAAAAVVPAGGQQSSKKGGVPTKYNKKKFDLLNRFQDVDLFFNPPTLNPELAAMLENDNYSHDSRKTLGPSNAPNKSVEEESFGFTLMILDNVKFHFKCSSEMEFLGWIQACRQGIERMWIEHMLDRRSEKDILTMDQFQVSFLLKLRADGPTKVLEIVENIDSDIYSTTASNKRNLVIHSGSHGSKKSKVLPFNLKYDRLKAINKTLERSGVAPEENIESELENEQTLNVVFAVQSVSLSLIDAEPSEILYLSLSGIEMTVDRTVDTVKFSGTVHEITISNQLLNPDFPVALFPRRMKDGAGGHSSRLMLPGLNQNRTTYPSLHLFLQQKYHQNISEIENSSGSSAHTYEQETKLRYFDMFTLWIAPIQLDVDEEIIVKVMRYVQSLRSAIVKSDLSELSNILNEEILNLSQQTNQTWGNIDPRAVYEVYTQFLNSNKKPYQDYAVANKNSSALYFSLLQLHPLDIMMSFRPSPNLVVSNAELAIISIISQLDCARLCLNALIAEHAFGTTSFMMDILAKHYRAAFWRQFHKFIGGSDIVEGSVGLVANLGTGVYDLFYEPIDGLLDENSSFLDGLSKGGKSLASRAIGGTSGFTSKITGGIGKGVSLLTLDSEFQRNRSYRRFNKTSTVSEGLYVGTKELGKNVVEGVTGIVMSPYRGWESGGGVGFGLGVAKGILGVALKPAVGVFDLASRATEGIRNTAFNEPDMMEERYGIHRKRIPRSFGRSGAVIVYDVGKAAAQYVADSLTNFRADGRLPVVYHQFLTRKIVNTEVYTAMVLYNFSISTYKVENNSVILDELELVAKESWGFNVGNNYLLLVCKERIVLVQILPSPPAAAAAAGASSSSKKKKNQSRKFIWSCPAACIEQFYHDPRGDLILSVNNSVAISGSWTGSTPTILDFSHQNYVIYQSLLEQTIGVRLARQQPLNPSTGMIQNNIYKRYSSGIRGLLMSPSKHTYRLFGNCLFEYTAKKAPKADKIENAIDEDPALNVPNPLDEIATNSEEYINKIISKLFNTGGSGASGAPEVDPLLQDHYCSFIYPLVDLYVVGPSTEDNGTRYSITLSRIDNQKMRTLRRDDDAEMLTEYQKISLSLIFSSFELASLWRKSIENHIVFRPTDVLAAAPLTTEEKRKTSRSLIRIGSNSNEEVITPVPNSILGLLVIPTCGCDPEESGEMKIQIARTMSDVKNA